MKRRAFLQTAGVDPLAPLAALVRAGGAPETLVAEPLKQLPFRSRRIPLGITTSRLRDIHLDDDDNAWIGANLPDRHIPVVDMKTGTCRRYDMNLGEGQYLDMVLPIGDKIVVCGGGYARQVFIDRKTGKRTEKPMATPDPLIYGGILVGPYAYLFDCDHGLYRWDARDDSREFHPYALPGKPLVGGHYAPQTRAIYGVAWWKEGMPPTPLVKFDTERKSYTAVFPPPWKGCCTMPPVQVGDILYMTDCFRGTLMLFDLKTERWLRRYRLPGHDTLWKYSTATTVIGPYVVCNLSTYQGTRNPNGTYSFDGKPHHFVDHLLIFDTRNATAGLLRVPPLSAGKYTTTAYMRTLKGKLYCTCVDSSSRPEGTPAEEGPAFLTEFSLEGAAA